MSITSQLHQNLAFTFINNVFYQKGFIATNAFEKDYINLRKKENRVYSDEMVTHLPLTPNNHPLKKEWIARKASLKKLIEHFKQNGNHTILEIGCGNGWLSRNLVESISVEICGIDVNECELLQGARLFASYKNLSLIYGDVFTVPFTQNMFDTILLPSCIQYFPDLKLLITRLFKYLSSHGEIIIFDSPFYGSQDLANAARKRSFDYFHSMGCPSMSAHYFHHTLVELADFSFKIIYNPSSIGSIVQRKFFRKKTSLFPFIQIKKT